MNKNSLLGILIFTFLANSINGQWKQTDGPYGGIIECLLGNNTNIFAACSGNNGGVYKSSDNGKIWTKISQDSYGNSLTYALGLTISENSLYVASVGVFRISLVNGVWLQDKIGLDQKFVGGVAIKDNDIYATVWNEGVYKSSDNGINWNLANTNLPTKQVRSIYTSGSRIYIGTSMGVFVSENNGTSWTELNNGLKNVDVKTIAIDANNLYIGSIGKGVFHLTTDGSFIEQINGGFNDSSPDIRGLEINNGEVYSSTWSGHVYKLNTQSRLWQSFDNNLFCDHIVSMKIFNNTLFVGSNGFGVYSTLLTTNDWQSSSTGIRAFKVNALASSDNFLMAATDASGVFLSRDEGFTWLRKTNGLTSMDANDLQLFDSNLFLGNGSGMFVSNDEGENWHLSNNGLNNQVNKIVVNKGRVFAVSFGNGLFYSCDTGKIWNEVNNSALPSKLIFSAAVRDSIIFLATYDAGVILSENLGNTWQQVNAGLNRNEISLVVMKDKYILINVCCGEGIYRSEDMGKTWIAKNQGLESAYVISLAVSKEIIIASTTNGVYSSKNNGDSWEKTKNFESGTTKAGVNIENVDTDIQTLTFTKSNIFAGSKNGSVWKLDLTNLFTTGIRTIPPDKTDLLIKNYPNPVSDLTKIEYKINNKEQVKIFLFDLSGRNLGLLLNEVKEPGTYYIDFKRNNLSGGLYFIKMITNEGMQISKMIIQ